MNDQIQFIKKQLSLNTDVFNRLLTGADKEFYLWKPAPGKWCLLEIVCHLYDEECRDFRARIEHVLQAPQEPFAPIDPQAWVTGHDYLGQQYGDMLQKFRDERTHSISWLDSLKKPKWDNVHQHPKLGAMSAYKLMCNWLAHDYLHIRQINALKYHYLKKISHENLTYAGNW